MADQSTLAEDEKVDPINYQEILRAFSFPDASTVSDEDVISLCTDLSEIFEEQHRDAKIISGGKVDEGDETPFQKKARLEKKIATDLHRDKCATDTAASKGRKRAVTKEADHFSQCGEDKGEYSDTQVQSGDEGESRTGKHKFGRQTKEQKQDARLKEEANISAQLSNLGTAGSSIAEALKMMNKTEAIKADNEKRRLDLEGKKSKFEHPEWYK